MKIDLVEEAQEQFAYREAWWRANRDAEDLFEEEYEQALEHLSTSPKSGDQYRIVRGRLIRRWLMEKTQCHIYYWYSEELDLIEITHSVQYRDLGTGNFLERYAVGYGRPDNYDVPSELWAIPKEKLSVTQSGSYLGQDGFRHDFTLDQIAERIGIETASAVPYP